MTLGAADIAVGSRGAIGGIVYHAGTKAFLEGALVRIDDDQGAPAARITARDGTFEFPEVAAGRHTLTASYTGLDASTITV